MTIGSGNVLRIILVELFSVKDFNALFSFSVMSFPEKANILVILPDLFFWESLIGV